MLSAIDQLLRVADAYRLAEGIGLSATSWRAFGDTKKLAAIVNGADIQVRRLEAAIVWFSEHWPETGVWPDGVPRPPIHVAPSAPPPAAPAPASAPAEAVS